MPADAFTAGTLGQERAGSGIVIRDTGLVLTIGYLVTEAENVVIIDDRGRATPAHPIAIDQESGFALVQALAISTCRRCRSARSAAVGVGEPVVMAGGGGARRFACRARVVAKQEFSGYWEYHINEALFTAPAHPLWGGAGLIGPDGRLIGVGSLHVQQSDGRGHTQDVNMSVPIDLLTPALDELLTYGRRNRPPRPWLGHVFHRERRARRRGRRLRERAGGRRRGCGRATSSPRCATPRSRRSADFYREIWGCGAAGAEIPIEIVRDRRSFWVRVKSGDRAAFLRKPRMN